MLDQAILAGKVAIDVAEARRALEALADGFGRVKKAAGESETGFQKFASFAEKGLDGVGKAVMQLNIGMATLRSGMEFMSKAGELRQSETAFRSLGVSIEDLRDAVDGTVAKTDLMRFANRQMRGELGLTEDMLKDVLAAADNLSDQGFGETIDIANKLTDALQTGKTKGLREFGFAIDETKDETEKIIQTFTELDKVLRDGSAEDLAAKNYEQLTARMKDATDSLIRKMGEWVDTAVYNWGRFLGIINDGDPSNAAGLRAAYAKGDPELEAAKAAGYEVVDPAAFRADLNQMDLPEADKRALRSGVDNVNKAAREAFRKDPRYAEYIGAAAERIVVENEVAAALALMEDEAKAQGRAGFANRVGDITGKDPKVKAPGAYRLGGEAGFTDLTVYNEQLRAAANEDAALWQKQLDAEARQQVLFDAEYEQQESDRRDQEIEHRDDLLAKLGLSGSDATTEQLEQVADTMDMLADRTRLAGAAFGAFSDGVGAAVDAVLSGENAWTAFAKVVSQQLKATAIESAVNALKYTALGIAATATGNPAAAGLFAAAKTFAVTAVAAGAGSALLGAAAGGGGGASAGSGSGGYAGPAGGGYVPPGGSSGSDQPTEVNITIEYDGDRGQLAEDIGRAVVVGQKLARGGSSSNVKLYG